MFFQNVEYFQKKEEKHISVIALYILLQDSDIRQRQHHHQLFPSHGLIAYILYTYLLFHLLQFL